MLDFQDYTDLAPPLVKTAHSKVYRAGSIPDDKPVVNKVLNLDNCKESRCSP